MGLQNIDNNRLMFWRGEKKWKNVILLCTNVNLVRPGEGCDFGMFYEYLIAKLTFICIIEVKTFE